MSTKPPRPLVQVQVQLQLGAAAQIERDDGVAVTLAPHDAVVLAWLALEGPTSRARMASMLWPASTEAQARAALRQRLWRLRKAAGLDLVGTGATLALDASVVHDLARSEEILGELCLADAPELDTWLQAQREQRRARQRDELQAQAQQLEDAGRADAALPVAQALLRREPLSEAAHRRVMRLHYLCGDRSAALVAFDHCEQVLKDEVGTQPSVETMAVLATIEAQTRALPPATRRSVPASVLRPPRMVGRDREFAQLEQAWTVGHVAAVIGEAGMGKTRLLHDFMQRHDGLARAAGRPGDAGVPFATLARLLRAVAGQWPDAAPALGAVLGSDVRQEIARVLPELGEAPVRHSEGQRLRLCRAISSYLAASGVHGLVVDDLHFSDAASLEMLQSLIDGEGEHASAVAPMRWLLAFRPAEAESSLLQLQQALAETARLAPVLVAPLGEAGLAQLVDDLALPEVHGAALAPMLLQHTGGNPLFVLETLKLAWVEQRLPQLAEGTLRLRPVSVGQLIEARMSRLSPEALALARVAGIAGVDFTIGLAEAVLRAGAIQFADALNELERAQVLKGTQFAHDLVFDAVLRSIPAVIAEHLHAEVARWLEQREGEPARVAQHWIEARQPANALPWLDRAAQRARSALRNTEQLGFLDLRADIEESLGLREAAFKTRREASQIYADRERSTDEGAARLDALERLADTEAQRIGVWLERAGVALRRAELDVAESFARRALLAAQARGDAELVQRGQITLFEVLTGADRAHEALVLGEACLGWMGDHTEREWRRNFHGALAVLYDNTGQLAKCVAHNERARQLTDRDDSANLSVVASNLCCAYGEAGRLTQALAAGLGSVQQAALLEGGQANAGITHLHLSNAGTSLGRYREALHWSEVAEALLAGSAPGGVAVAEVHRARCYLHLGQQARATQLMAKVDADPGAVFVARVRRHLLGCALARERRQPALPHIESGLALLQERKRVDLHELLLIERAMTLPATHALIELADIGARAKHHEAGGRVLETLMRAAQIALDLDTQLARAHALEALETADQYGLVASYPGELWLHVAQALFAAGDRTAGLAVLRRGTDWVQATAREQVPAEFQDSFLRRNPTNAALRALAAGHGFDPAS